MLKERGIIFSAPMVRALLAGTKTQTRRIYKGTPKIDGEQHPDGSGETWTEWGRCPYGVPGDRLWVRETWGYFNPDDTGDDIEPDRRDTSQQWAPELMQDGHPLRNYWRRRIAYKATFAEDKYGKGAVAPGRWRPSIHMPRWASRITLEITDVRVQRLQEISEADAMAEGIGRYDNGTFGLNDPGACMGTTAVVAYMRLWESINGPGSWEASPWVWVLAFRRL